MYIVISFVVSLIIGVAGYFLVVKERIGPKCPQCPPPEEWSKCDENNKKTRTNYSCGKDTNYECKGYKEEELCKTSISAQGKNGLGVTVSPTKDKYIEGIITVSIDSLPSNSGEVIVLLSPKDEKLTDNPYLTPGVFIKYLEPQKGQSVEIDTRGVSNGEYKLDILVEPKTQTEAVSWSDLIQIPFVVEN